MNLPTAKNVLISLIDALEGESRSEFLSWCKERYFPAVSSSSSSYFELRTIAEDIKTMVPIEAIYPDERIDYSLIKQRLGTNQDPIVHVDSFLFEEDHIDALVEEKKLSRNYCKKCGSTDVAPITFISHSISVKRLEYIFQHLLPDLSGKTVLDVGSRIGAVLYGAYYYSAAEKIIGVEISKAHCDLQNHIINKYSFKDRIKVLHNNVVDIPDVLKSADVIILNNVLECFMPKEMQESVWWYLRNTITNPDTIIVTIPSLEETFSSLQIDIDIDAWVRKVAVEDVIKDPEAILKFDDEDSLSEVCLYVQSCQPVQILHSLFGKKIEGYVMT